jgi:hypothetical protein
MPPPQELARARHASAEDTAGAEHQEERKRRVDRHLRLAHGRERRPQRVESADHHSEDVAVARNHDEYGKASEQARGREVPRQIVIAFRAGYLTPANHPPR